MCEKMTEVTDNLITFPFNFKEGHLKLNSNTKSSNVSGYVGKYDPLIFCRTCANMDSCLVPIFKKEGLEYNLNKKIEKYLPIRVSQEDDLPVHLCYHCASTLIAWDTLLVGCVEAEKKLTLLKNSLQNKINDEEPETEKKDARLSLDSDDEPLINIKSIVENKRDNIEIESTQEKDETFPSKRSTKIERLMEEPVVTFSAYQYHIVILKPLLFEILNLKIDNSFCCEICTTVVNLKSKILQTKINLRACADNSRKSNKSKNKCKIILTKNNKNHGNKMQIKSKSEIICKRCGKILGCKLSLKKHMKIHCYESKFACHKCEKVFRHRFNLLRHVRVIHEGERKHVCVDCGKRFRSRGEMTDHQNVHEARRKIICDECGLIFLTKASFYSHKKSHRSTKCEKMIVYYSCEKCQKKFTTKKSRNQHALIHTGEKPISCTVCGKNFRTKANFSQHLKIHSNVKPFCCDYCGKTFARKDHLKIHVRCHTGEKPFICNTCNRAFTQMNDMKKHSKIHEKNK